jgi:hypothetical protein
MTFQPEVHVPHGSSVGTLKTGIIKQALINGGAAGDLTVTGIEVGDELVSVLHYTSGAALADLTSEFSISAADTINNTGGTATTGDQLWITWIDKSKAA